MAQKLEEKVDLYDERGNLLVRDVPLWAISPLRNPAIKKIVSLVVRAGAIDLAGLETRLRTGRIGGKGMVVRGLEMDLDLVGKADEIAKEIEDLLRVEEGDDSAVKVLAARVDVASIPELRAQADGLREKMGSASVGVLGTVMDEKPSLIAFVSDDLVKSGRVKAGDVVRITGEMMGARGGGKPHMAQAGGGDASRLEEALGSVVDAVRELLNDA